MSATPVFMNAHLARIRPDRFTLLLIVIALLGTGLVLARQITYGVSLWGDSISYISTARGLLAGEGLTEIWQGTPLSTKPPLYPMLLATGSMGLFDPWDVAGPFNAICHGLTVLIAGQWLRRHVRSPILTIWGSLAVTLFLPLIDTAGAAVADAPFYLLTTLALTRFSTWSEEPKRATLLQAGVFTALACLTRYPGIALIPVFVLMLLLQRNTSASMKASHISKYVLIASIPIGLYLIRNYFHFGTFTTNFVSEERQQGVRTVSGILEETIRYIGGWVVPGVGITGVTHLVLPIFLILSVMTGFVYFVNRKGVNYPFLAYMAAYFIIVTASLNSGATAFGLEDRYIMALYIPFILILSVTLDGVFHFEKWRNFRIPERIPVLGGIAGIAVIAFLPLYGWLGYNAKLNEAEIRLSNSRGYFREVEFNSEIREYIKNISSQMIWGNIDPHDVHFHSGKKWSEYHPLPNTYSEIPAFIENAAIGDYIIWWIYSPPHIEYTFEELRASEGLDFVTTLRDGHVLRISKRTHAEKYAAITSRKPDIVSEFNVYLSGRDLSWTKEPCRQFEIQDPVFVHVIPRNISVLPEERRYHGFDSMDFSFPTTGVIFDGKCMATISLPDYQITTILTGQDSEQLFWSGRIYPPLDTSRIQTEYDSITSGEPVARSVYSVWINGLSISYTRDPCTEDDAMASFFLHVVAVDANDLPDDRKGHGFDSRDFAFERETGSVRFDGKCLATRLLPEYPIASIHTGQYDASGQLWSVDILLEVTRED